jgi:bifunctional DNA-binding transcriptional regulator/antitoxin component of YhaV-PrlF toxin-antitoxin module
MSMQRRKAKRPQTSPQPAQATERTRVGNLGCIRFPLSIRKASGIKRGDRLVAKTGKDSSVVLSKLPAIMPEETLLVDECACQKKPEGCSVPKSYLDVGWSYVQFDSARAEELGLVPGTPLTLVAEPFRITLSIERLLSRKQIEAISPVRCPP